jgi:hypothetical protein
VKTAGEKKNLAGRELDRDQLTTMTGNLPTGETRPVTIIESADCFTDLGSLVPSGAKHNSQIEILGLRQ